jgi:acyl-coenzyme A thioesterase PaaI-like protein
MTAAVEVRFRKPVPLGVPLVLHGHVNERRRTMLFLEATLGLAENDTLLATAKGTFVSTGRL